MIIFNLEVLTQDLLDEMKPLADKARLEVYTPRESKTLNEHITKYGINNIDSEFFLYMQKNNKFVFTTIRDQGVLVGYWALIKTEHQQCKDLIVANSESLYILKEYRIHNMSKNFIFYTENVLKKEGVKMLYVNVNPLLKTDKILKRYGYSMGEVVMEKDL